MKPANVADYRELARRRIPKVLFDYVDGGSYSEATLRANSADFEKVALRQRVLVDVSSISLKTQVLGQEIGLPLVLSPVGMAGMYARRGEVQAARAAGKAGVPLCLSSMSICDQTEVVKGCGAPSSCRPPWLDTTRPSKPQRTACLASATSWTPFRTILPG